jgi:hypothetical protein
MRYGFKTFGALAVGLGSLFAIATTATDSLAGGNYSISYSVGACKAGSECTVTVNLKVTADGYHVNKDFNHKITAKADGVKFMSGDSKNGEHVFSKQGGHVSADEKASSVTIKFKADHKGKVEIHGDYRLLVCTEAKCAPETTQISATVDVK